MLGLSLLSQLFLMAQTAESLLFLEPAASLEVTGPVPVPILSNSTSTSSSSLIGGTAPSPPALPAHMRTMSQNNLNVVIAYALFFVLGASGNLSVFLSVCRQLGKLKWRITILIVHLSVADLIVTFCVIPSEIFWRITVQFYGGNALCKLLQFCRAFGLYLSSMVLICISLDRFFAILYPLKMVGATRRVKGMLALAWLFAAVFSLPQLIVFRVESHPDFSSFRQCVSIGFFSSRRDEILYNVFSVSAMYFVPLLVIIFTYLMILWKITQKSREHNQAKRETKGTYGSRAVSSSSGGARQTRLLLRSTDSAAMMARAKSRTLRLTFIIVLVFVFCWTPYAVMLLWYMFDRDSASKVDVRVQDGFFMMVIANSCVNPLVYGNYARETQGSVTSFCFKRGGSTRRPTDQLPITSVI